MNRLLEILQERNMNVLDLSYATGATITENIWDMLPSDLAKVSAYLDISCDYLLGLTEKRERKTEPFVIDTVEKAMAMVELFKELEKHPE